MRRLAAVLVHVALAATLGAADFTAVDTEVERSMKSGLVPGAAIVIVKDGEVVHSRAFGVASVETSAPVTPKTLFRLGSTTKMFVALATLRLVDEGKLPLTQPVGDVVPGLAPALKAITIEQLLSHTSGLADDAPMNGPLDESALHERVTSWREDALFAPPGDVFSYANTGYVLLGDAIAQVTHQPFSAAMQSLVLDPMGMRDSTFKPLVAFTHPVALGHDRSGVIRPVTEHAGNYPPGSLFTSVEDLGRFFAALTPQQLERLAAARVPIPAQDRTYGYGIVADDRRGVPILLHTGGRSGYGSTFMFLPSQHVAVAVLSNRTSATLSSAAFLALEQYAKLGEIPAMEGEVALPADQLAGLLGTYANGKGLPSIELAEEGGKLVVRFAGKSLAVNYAGKDRFHVEGGAQLETFVIVRDKSGTPRYLCAETWAFRKRS